VAIATLATTAGLTGVVAGCRVGTVASAVTRTLAGVYAVRYGRAQARILADSAAPPVRAAVAAGILELPTLQGALASRAGSALAGVAVAAAAPLARRLARKVSPT
jgi:4-hydroxybenzoate polyprenyltransferase